jgi:hypothetical protein
MSEWEVVPDPNVLAAQAAAAEAAEHRKYVDEQLATLGNMLLAFKVIADAMQAVVLELQRPRTLKVTKRHKDGAIMEAEMRPT